MNMRLGIKVMVWLFVPLVGQASVVDEQLAGYRGQGAGPFRVKAGKALWQQKIRSARDGHTRSCSTCHGTDLEGVGKHVNTGKAIEPLSPRVNKARLSNAKTIRKWLRRNCKWTWGRECTAQEKGDLLSYINSQ